LPAQLLPPPIKFTRSTAALSNETAKAVFLAKNVSKHLMKIPFIILLSFTLSTLFAQTNEELIQGKWVLSEIRTIPSDCDYDRFEKSNVLADTLIVISIEQNRITIAKKSNFLPTSSMESNFHFFYDTIKTEMPESGEIFTSVFEYLILEPEKKKNSKEISEKLKLVKLSNEFLTLEDYVFDRESPLLNSSTQRYYFKKIDLQENSIKESHFSGKWYSKNYLKNYYSELPDTLHLTRDSITVLSDKAENYGDYFKRNELFNFTIDSDGSDYYSYDSNCLNCLIQGKLIANLPWLINIEQNSIRISNLDYTEWYQVIFENDDLILIKK